MDDLSRQVRILLVEPDSLERARLGALLQKSGLPARIAEAGCVADALAAQDFRSFDCAVFEHKLPDGDGLTLAAQLAEASTGLVMVTATGDERLAVAAMKQGVHDYLPKDRVTPEGLREAVEQAIESAHRQKTVEAKTEQLERLSLFDHLTQIANRHLFFDRLEQAIRTAKRGNKRLAVFQLDLDLFKEVNDAFGHQTGDELLRLVAKRLQDTLRESDTVARLGGDEFAGLLPSTESLEGALVLAQRMHEAIVEPAVIGGRRLSTGASIGLALFPDHGDDARALLHAADLAMYDAKRNGAKFKIYESNRKSTLLTSQLPQNLDRALERGEFLLHYQPILDLRSGAVQGVEALVRWQHPELGLLPPLEFIPSAERTALIRPLTVKVLDGAVRQAAAWQAAGMPLQLSINLSACLLHDQGFAAETEDLLKRHGLPASRLTLEVTESGLLTNFETAGAIIGALDDLGVTISIDDFSAGFTSLRYLRELPVSEIKIDKLFVDGLMLGNKAEAIMASILSLGRAMAVSVVIEGIEDSDAWQKILGLGGQSGQGFCFTCPLPAAEFEAWYRSWHGRLRASFQTDSAVVEALLA